MAICDNCIHDEVCGLEGHLDEALTFCLNKVADVQPVDRWINVNEALPIYDGLVLICYNNKRIRLGAYTEDGWDSDEGNPIMEQPDFWARIPEPPETMKR